VAHIKPSNAPNEGNARHTILAEAARLFAQNGYDGTSMRDIASACTIQVSSAYHHFQSKEALFLAVCKSGIDAIYSAVTLAISTVHDPWERLEVAVVAHLEALLNAGDFAVVSAPYFPATLEMVRIDLRHQRDQYERVIVELVDALTLAPEIDRKIFRLLLLGALNWTPTWYRAGQQSTPATIGRQLVLTFRNGTSVVQIPPPITEPSVFITPVYPNERREE